MPERGRGQVGPGEGGERLILNNEVPSPAGIEWTIFERQYYLAYSTTLENNCEHVYRYRSLRHCTPNNDKHVAHQMTAKRLTAVSKRKPTRTQRQRYGEHSRKARTSGGGAAAGPAMDQMVPQRLLEGEREIKSSLPTTPTTTTPSSTYLRAGGRDHSRHRRGGSSSSIATRWCSHTGCRKAQRQHCSSSFHKIQTCWTRGVGGWLGWGRNTDIASNGQSLVIHASGRCA